MSLLTNWLESLSYDLEISDACLKKISPLSSCTACLDSCPHGAFLMDYGKIEIDPKACTHCGVCITVCHTQAIKGQSPQRNVLQKYLLITEESKLPSVMELLYFYKKGIVFIHFTHAASELEERVRSVNEYLEAMGMDLFQLADHIELEQEQQPKLTRRDFFTKLTLESKNTVLSTLTPAKWRFNEGSFQLSSLYKEWAFFKVDINAENCTLCEACFNICPSNVFEVSGSNLKIDAQKCSGCNICQDICRSKAIAIEKNIHQPTVTARQVHKSACSKCGSSFYSWNQTEQCQICSASKPNFFT